MKEIQNKPFKTFHYYFILYSLLLLVIPAVGSLNLLKYANYTIIFVIWIAYAICILFFYIYEIRTLPYKIVSKGNTIIIKMLWKSIVVNTKSPNVSLNPNTPKDINLLYPDSGILTIKKEYKKKEFVVDYKSIENLFKKP
jgi:hypothetical protein